MRPAAGRRLLPLWRPAPQPVKAVLRTLIGLGVVLVALAGLGLLLLGVLGALHLSQLHWVRERDVAAVALAAALVVCVKLRR